MNYEKVEILGKYFVYIGKDLISNLAQIVELVKCSKIFLITDDTLESIFAEDFAKINNLQKIIISSGEKAKNIDSLQEIWKQLLEKGADRKSLVINLGGGAVLDMGGFAAATFMRGISFIHIPTTLLSQVDASVGGKLAIDFAGVKNLIGSFNQPLAVIVDINTLKSLPEREFISGFGEILKHGLIADKDYFQRVSQKDIKNLSDGELVKIIEDSVKIKSEIINSDEKELGNRKLLNFGHTIGHAIESVSLETDNSLLHGEAVVLGMVAEGKISREKGYITEEELQKIANSFKKIGLLTSYKILDLQKVIEFINKDKKTEGGIVKWTLLKSIGEGVIDQSVSERELLIALNFLKP